MSWATGAYSHTTIALDAHHEIEVAIEDHGVNVGKIDYHRPHDIISVPYDSDAMVDTYTYYQHKPYGVIQAITLGLRVKFGLNLLSEHGVICSEFVAYYLKLNKYIHLPIDDVNLVTPTNLYRMLNHATLQ